MYALQLGRDDNGPIMAAGKYLNRHGLITGATGTGKSVSLMGMVEGFQRLGVPTFVTDIKGDLSGLAAMSNAAMPGDQLGAWFPQACDVVPLDVYGDKGLPITASLSSMPPALVARALGLSDAQSGVLEIVYAVAADDLTPLHTLADLRAMVAYCSERRGDIAKDYGLVTPSSVAAIGRAILGLERSGGAGFFSAQSFDVGQLTIGKAVHLLDCTRLHRSPRLYGAVMLWLLDALYSALPEVGDMALPKLALFIDEAHLLFADPTPGLMQMIDETVRLIRSKGVGVYFATQAPGDLPDSVARQLHLRVQHALRAVTPRDRAQVRGAADSLPNGEGFRNVDMIEKLPPGVALVSVMSEAGIQTPTRICKMALPRCRLTPLTDSERHTITLGKRVTVEVPRGEPVKAAPVAKQDRFCGPALAAVCGTVAGVIGLVMMFTGPFVAGCCVFGFGVAVLGAMATA